MLARESRTTLLYFYQILIICSYFNSFIILGYDRWKWGNTAVRRLMVETAVIGEYFHIYRSFWRSHMCAVDGQPHYLVCPETCDADLPFEECTCRVDALVNGTCTVLTGIEYDQISRFIDTFTELFCIRHSHMTLFAKLQNKTYLFIHFLSLHNFAGNTTWQNLFPCLLNSESNRDFFLAVMPEEMISDLVVMTATASVQEVRTVQLLSFVKTNFSILFINFFLFILYYCLFIISF